MQLHHKANLAVKLDLKAVRYYKQETCGYD